MSSSSALLSISGVNSNSIRNAAFAAPEEYNKHLRKPNRMTITTFPMRRIWYDF